MTLYTSKHSTLNFDSLTDRSKLRGSARLTDFENHVTKNQSHDFMTRSLPAVARNYQSIEPKI